MVKIRYTYIFLLALACYSCDVRNVSITEKQNQITIVLSKPNSSDSYRNFIERIDTTIQINWVSAYSTPLNQLSTILEQADGIILTGGVDIHPSLYGNSFDTIRCGTIDTVRDEIETKILDYALHRKIPCLGICRGLQIMNVHMGGSLHSHLPDTLSHIHRGHSGAVTHPIKITKNIGVLEIDVTDILDPVSNHHQGISRLAKELEVWAVAPDGLSEGVRHKDTIAHPFFVGVQWHPEKSGDINALGVPIGEGFLTSVLQYKVGL